MENIIGIDPGKNLGIAILKVENKKIRYYLTNCNNLEKDYMVIKNPNMSMDQKKIVNVNYIIKRLYRHFPFTYVGIETIFKHKFANAVIQLSAITTMLKSSIYNVNTNAEIIGIEPKKVKRCIGASGKGDKDDVLEALLKINEFKNLSRDITSHESDALAIAYITYKTLLENNKI